MDRRAAVRIAVLALLVLSLLRAPSTFAPPRAQAGPNEALTAVSEDEALSIALAHVRGQAGALNLTAADLADLQVVDLYIGDIGLTYVYLLQHVNGLPIHNALINVTVGADGRVVHTGNRGEANIAARANSATPVLTPAEAIAAAATALGLPQPQGLTVLAPAQDMTQKTVFNTGGISLEAIPVSLVYQPAAGTLQLAWNLSIYELDAQHHWSVRVDAVTGALLAQDDGVIHDHWDLAGPLSMSKLPGPRFRVGGPRPFAGAHYAAPMTPDAYRVFAVPVESPNHGGRTLATNPADTLAAPFGWHDTNGAAGAEFTTTQGNNAHGYTDTDANNTPDPGSSPDGGPTLVFDFPLDLTQAPSGYRPAAVTNLFYWNNLSHDLNYRYGFTEAARNFQANNYGRGGLASDYVYAEAQDGSGTNSANFFSGADGVNGRMQMFVWTAANPDRDGDLDNGIILHEYGHGVSNRQTGGGVGCLSNAEQMGEGWSDWQTLIFTARATDTATIPRGVGTYVLDQPPTGPGIREFPYSTDLTINSHTYNRTRTAAAPHGVGSVWTAMLWEVYWNFVGQYGFDTNFATGTGGNNRIIRLVNEGLKLQPCSPGFVDGRNAILAADQAINQGANQCFIWAGFAKRGLGFSASQGSSATNADNTEAFDLPQACIGATPTPTRTVTGTPPTNTPTQTTTRTPSPTATVTTTRTPTTVVTATTTRTPTVTATAGTGPDITVVPAVITETHAMAGMTTQRILTIGNVGSAPLTWTIYEETAPAANPAPALPSHGDRSMPVGAAPAAPAEQLPSGAQPAFGALTEGFDDITTLPGAGWALINRSSPVGTTGWFQGNSEVFPAHAGGPTSYIEANFNTTTGTNTISNWLLTPVLSLQNGDILRFRTRTTEANPFPDRLQVRMSTAGASTNVGASATDVGDFTSLLLDINPTYQTGGVYPEAWTEFTVTIGGVPAATNGRLAFRYFVENGGPSGDNSNYIGIDTVSYTSTVAGACATNQNIPWLTVAPTNGTTAPGGSTPVTLTFNSTGLANGTYTGDLCTESNDPDESQVRVPVTLRVGSATAVQVAAFDQAPATPLRPLLVGVVGLAGLALTAGLRRRWRTR